MDISQVKGNSAVQSAFSTGVMKKNETAMRDNLEILFSSLNMPSHLEKQGPTGTGKNIIDLVA